MATDLVEHDDLTPMVMIQSAIDQKLDPDQLRTLVDMQREWQQDRAREAYNMSMKLAQEEMPIVVRDAVNNHTKKRYAKLETVSNQIKPIYTKHGFSLSYGTESSQLEKHVRVICDCMHDKGHTRTYRGDFPYDEEGAKGNANKTAIQAVGSTLSYARRYLKLMIFDVTVADEDNDGQNGAVITPDQIGDINDLLLSTNSDITRFLKWAGVESLDKMPASKFQEAMTFLQRKAKR